MDIGPVTLSNDSGLYFGLARASAKSIFQIAADRGFHGKTESEVAWKAATSSRVKRFGKGAFIAGVFDARAALTAPIESGTGGLPVWRGVPGEITRSLSGAYGEQPWLDDAFSAYTGNPPRQPLDTHELVALVVPRGLSIMDNPLADPGPRSAHIAALAGAGVYKALGAGDAISYHSNVASGTHCANRADWVAPLSNHIRKFLKGESAMTGGINARPSASGDLS